MSFRGRGRGRGGFGGGWYRPAKQEPFELFPEIKELGSASHSSEKLELIKWSWSLQKYWKSSPYYYEDGSERPEKVQKTDVLRYSDRKLQATEAKPPLWHYIKLDADHIPAELAEGEKRKQHVAKRVCWNTESGLDLRRLDFLEELDRKDQGKGAEKENEEEEEEVANEEDDGEYSDEGDYEQAADFDDDEDDFNMAEDNDDDTWF